MSAPKDYYDYSQNERDARSDEADVFEDDDEGDYDDDDD